MVLSCLFLFLYSLAKTRCDSDSSVDCFHEAATSSKNDKMCCSLRERKEQYRTVKLPGPLQKREILPLMLGVSLRLLYCSAPGRTPRLLRSYKGEKTTVPCSELSFWKKSRAQLFSKVTLPKILIRQHIVYFSRQPSGTQKTNNPVLQFVS